MGSEELAAKLWDQVLAELDLAPEGERVGILTCIQDRLSFEMRWQALTDAQHRHMEDESLSDAERNRLKECTSEKEREEYITMYARARYFRRCAWTDFLNGVIDEPPLAAQAAGEE